MMLDIIDTALKLKETSENLRNMKDNSSSDELSRLVKDFEIEVDRLNVALIDTFGDDSDIMQFTYELKSAVVALRDDNVESGASIS